jgi:hypothetical protein
MELAKINSKPDALVVPRIIIFFTYGMLILPTTDIPAVCVPPVFVHQITFCENVVRYEKVKLTLKQSGITLRMNFAVEQL